MSGTASENSNLDEEAPDPSSSISGLTDSGDLSALSGLEDLTNISSSESLLRSESKGVIFGKDFSVNVYFLLTT